MSFRHFYNFDENTLKLPISHLSIEGKHLPKRVTDIFVKHNLKNINDLINALDEGVLAYLDQRLFDKMRLGLLYLSFDGVDNGNEHI